AQPPSGPRRWDAQAQRWVVDQAPAAETVDELLTVGKLGIATDLVTAVAGVLALLFVRRLTAMQNTMATEGPYARS
ncbi:hypothetical protein ABTX80_37185, partial [Streptomyces erythrochromogenes]